MSDVLAVEFVAVTALGKHRACYGDWTDERVELLKQLAGESESYGNIARKINDQTGSSFTRCATVGKAKRLGLCKERAPVERSQRSFRRKSVAVESSYAAPVPAPVVGVGYSFLGLTFADLPDHGCRYPQGGDRLGDPIFFCGQPQVALSSYCEHCRAICEPGWRSMARYQSAERAVA